MKRKHPIYEMISSTIMLPGLILWRFMKPFYNYLLEGAGVDTQPNDVGDYHRFYTFFANLHIIGWSIIFWVWMASGIFILLGN